MSRPSITIFMNTSKLYTVIQTLSGYSLHTIREPASTNYITLKQTYSLGHIHKAVQLI